MKFSKLFEIGIINTIRLNVHYFGWAGAVKPVIVASRNLKIRKMQGRVIARDKSFGAVRIGFGDVGIVDKKYCRSIWENVGTIEFLGKARLGVGTKISNRGILTFGDDCRVNANSDIVCAKAITLGNNALISWECLLMDTDFHGIYSLDDLQKQLNPDKEVVIGDHVWIGCRCTILKGSVIPEGSVIAACSRISARLDKCNAIYKECQTVREGVCWDF